MAAFDPQDPTRFDRVDWKILTHGASGLFNHQSLDAAYSWLRDYHYHILQFECDRWQTGDDFLQDVMQTLNMPDVDEKEIARHRSWGEIEYFAQDIFAHGLEKIVQAPVKDVALVFWQFESFHQNMPETANSTLSLLEMVSREYLLTGSKLIALVHTENYDLDIETVGCNWQLGHPF